MVMTTIIVRNMIQGIIEGAPLNESFKHAEDCFNITGNRNKATLEEFEQSLEQFVKSSKTSKVNGSYRYETPAYHYQQKGSNLVVTVNPTDNAYVTVRNATDFQFEKRTSTRKYVLI